MGLVLVRSWKSTLTAVIWTLAASVCFGQSISGTGWMFFSPPVATPTPTFSPSPTPSLTPAPSPTAPVWIDPLIVDNLQAEVVGEWQTGTSAGDKWATDYRFAYAGDGSAYLIFRPTLPATGSYQVSEWHPQGTNRTSQAPVTVFHSGGNQTHLVDQKTLGGTWNLLGTYTMAAGTDCYVRISNQFTGSEVVMADAIRFAFVNTAPSPTPTLTPTPAPTPTGGVRPFGEYVQMVMDELDQRKATDVSGYLMKDMYGKYTGVTQTLWYKGTSYMWNECAKNEPVVITGSTYYPYGHSYCSGLTLEVFHRAMEKRDRELGIAKASENWNGLGTKGIFIVKKLWNVITIRYSDTNQVVTSQPCPATALELSGVGKIITLGDSSKFEQVRKYDFCDISRTTGSGHSVIFIEWIRNAQNAITGLRYYSSQSSTDGQGYGTEYFSDSGGTVMKSLFRAGRVYDSPSEWTTNSIREVAFTQ